MALANWKPSLLLLFWGSPVCSRLLAGLKTSRPQPVAQKSWERSRRQAGTGRSRPESQRRGLGAATEMGSLCAVSTVPAGAPAGHAMGLPPCLHTTGPDLRQSTRDPPTEPNTQTQRDSHWGREGLSYGMCVFGCGPATGTQAGLLNCYCVQGKVETLKRPGVHVPDQTPQGQAPLMSHGLFRAGSFTLLTH